MTRLALASTLALAVGLSIPCAHAGDEKPPDLETHTSYLAELLVAGGVVNHSVEGTSERIDTKHLPHWVPVRQTRLARTLDTFPSNEVMTHGISLPEGVSQGRGVRSTFENLVVEHLGFPNEQAAQDYAIVGRGQGIVDVRGTDVVVVRRTDGSQPNPQQDVGALQAAWEVNAPGKSGAHPDLLLVSDAGDSYASLNDGGTGLLNRHLASSVGSAHGHLAILQGMADDEGADPAARRFAQRSLESTPFTVRQLERPDRLSHRVVESKRPETAAGLPVDDYFLETGMGMRSGQPWFAVQALNRDHGGMLLDHLSQVRRGLTGAEAPGADPQADMLDTATLLSGPPKVELKHGGAAQALPFQR